MIANDGWSKEEFKSVMTYVNPVRSIDPLPVATTSLPTCSNVTIYPALAFDTGPALTPSTTSAPTADILPIRIFVPARLFAIFAMESSSKYCAIG
jgi:hypothetical protein